MVCTLVALSPLERAWAPILRILQLVLHNLVRLVRGGPQLGYLT